MRPLSIALSLCALLIAPHLSFAQAAPTTQPTEAAPAPTTPASEPAPVPEAAAPATTPAPAPAAEAAMPSTAPADRIIVSPQQQEAEEGQIDLQALTDEEEVPRFVLGGYYRVRGNYFHTLGLDSNAPQRIERFIQHRLRMEPTVNLVPNVTFKAQLDALDNQVWGSNPGNVLSQSTADRVPNLIVKRAYAEVKLPFGQLSAGRMPSNWGMGLLSNDGNDFKNEFGDANGGSTFDRVAFGTKPLGIDSNWVVAAVYDKIVADQPQALVAKNDGAVDEFVGVLLFNTDPLKFGVYHLYRQQTDTETFLHATDVYFKLDLGLLYAETEQVWLGRVGLPFGLSPLYTSHTRAVPVLSLANNQVTNPKVEIAQYGYAARVGINVDPYGAEFEWGNATGDRNSFDDYPNPKVTNFKFHADYNVGLIMFDFANALLAQRQLDAKVSGLDTLVGEGIVTREAADRALSVGELSLTNGSVTNAFYINPKLRLHLMDGKLDLTIAYLTASANAPTISRKQGKNVEQGDYGNEYDAAVNYNFTKNFVFGVQYGYFRPGNFFNTQELITGDINRPDDAQVVQGRFTALF